MLIVIFFSLVLERLQKNNEEKYGSIYCGQINFYMLSMFLIEESGNGWLQ